MRTHTQEFKSKIKEHGREFDDTLYYSANGVTTTYDNEHLSNINYSFDTSLLKSVMQTLTFDSDLDLEVGNIVSYKCSLVDVQNSDIELNNFTITKKEEQKDTKNYRYTCYDNMIKSMTDYVSLNVTYPITIRNYINAICTYLGITFANASDIFTNYNKTITSEHYLDSDGNSLGYTFRDVLDDLAEAVGGFICIDNYGELEIRYPINTNDTIDEEYFQDNNVNIGKKYGPINVVVLSRNGVDNLVRPSTLPTTITEIKIENNPILDQTNREDFIDGIYNQLNGLEFYLNDFQTKGVMYYEVGDIYNVSIDNTTYKCLMLNDNIIRESGLAENIYTEEPTTSVTDYKYASDTDKLEKTSRNAYFLADKANGVAEMIVEGIGSNGQVTGASVIASINDDESNLTLNADKINLNGAVTANNNFQIGLDGSVSINNGNIDLIDDGTTTSNPRIKITSVNQDKWCELFSGGLIFQDPNNTYPVYSWILPYQFTLEKIIEDDNELWRADVSAEDIFFTVEDTSGSSNTEKQRAWYGCGAGGAGAIHLGYGDPSQMNFQVTNTSSGSDMYLSGDAQIEGNTTIGDTLYYGTGGRQDYAGGGYTYDQYGNMTSKSTGTNNNWNFRGGNGASDYVVRIYPNSTPKRVVLYTKSFNLTDGAITTNFTNSFQTSLFGETNYNYRVKPFRNGNIAYTPTAGTYSPSLGVTTGDTHFMISCNYGATPICKISGGNVDTLNWTQAVGWAGEDLYTTAFNIGATISIANLSSYKYMEIYYGRGNDYGQASQKVRLDTNKLTNISIFYRSGNTMRRHTAIVTWDTSANTVTFSSMIEEILTTSGGVTTTSIVTSSNNYDKIFRIVGYKN